jgi:hypothetical protein
MDYNFLVGFLRNDSTSKFNVVLLPYFTSRDAFHFSRNSIDYSALTVASVIYQLSKLSKSTVPHSYSLPKAGNSDGERASVILEPVCFITLQPL